MKILNETKKELLPSSVLTAFTSKCWEEVGVLKEEIKALNETFSGSKKVTDIMQDLLDAYLICIGRLEKHMKDKDYIDFPKDTDSEESPENLKEDLIINTTTVISNGKNTELSDETNLEVEDDNQKLETNSVSDIAPMCNSQNKLKHTGEAFEYYCDFEDPLPLTAADQDL